MTNLVSTQQAAGIIGVSYESLRKRAHRLKDFPKPVLFKDKTNFFDITSVEEFALKYNSKKEKIKERKDKASMPRLFLSGKFDPMYKQCTYKEKIDHARATKPMTTVIHLEADWYYKD
jgi:hypothetical protein